MKKSKNSFYVVWVGREKGIFDTWDKCKKHVDGIADAKYKGFPTLEEAKKALAGNHWEYYNKREKPVVDTALRKQVGEPIRDSICVDAACSGNPGELEYRGIYMLTGEEIFHRGPFPEGTVNIGEFLAIVTGLAWMKQRNISLPLYSDSRNGLLWVKHKKVNTKLNRTPKNEELFLVLEKALEWLHTNSYTNTLLKWETAAWGEIPADFGRK